MFSGVRLAPIVPADEVPGPGDIVAGSNSMSRFLAVLDAMDVIDNGADQQEYLSPQQMALLHPFLRVMKTNDDMLHEPPKGFPRFAPADETTFDEAIEEVFLGEANFKGAWFGWIDTKSKIPFSVATAMDWGAMLRSIFTTSRPSHYNNKKPDMEKGEPTLRAYTTWGGCNEGFIAEWSAPLLQPDSDEPDGPRGWQLYSYFTSGDPNNFLKVGSPYVWALLTTDVESKDEVSFGELSCVVYIIRERFLAQPRWLDYHKHFSVRLYHKPAVWLLTTEKVLLFTANRDSVRVTQAYWSGRRLKFLRFPPVQLRGAGEADFERHKVLLRWMMARPLPRPPPRARPRIPSLPREDSGIAMLPGDDNIDSEMDTDVENA